MTTKIRRLLIGPSDTAGYSSHLAGGFWGLGIRCDLAVPIPHPFDYQTSAQIPPTIRFVRLLHRLAAGCNRAIVRRGIRFFAQSVFSVWAVGALVKYDAFIFGFGRSLFPQNLDLPVLRALGKTVVSNIGHGSESRPPFIDGAFRSTDTGESPSATELVQLVAQTVLTVSRHEKYATVMIGHPLSTSQFATRQFVNSLSLGIPSGTIPPEELGRGPGITVGEAEGQVKILHAPSHRFAKGTEEIEIVIQALQAKGFNIAFELAEKMSNLEVLGAIQECDFVIDQVYSDGPLPGFATEAAWFAKPAVVAGYGIDLLRKFVPPEMWPPSKICSPTGLAQAVQELIECSTERRRLGLEAQAFVREFWNERSVARRYLQLLESGPPDSWLTNPGDVDYILGAGQPLEITKANVSKLVREFGPECLGIKRWSLQRRFLELAGEQS